MGGERLWSQVVGAVVMSQTHVIFAVWITFGGLLIAESQSGDPGAQLSPKDATLVASISHLGRMAGCLVSAQLTDRLGVLRVIQLSTPLNLLAWPLMTLGSKSMMLAGAILAGAFVGLNASGGRLYIAEVTSTSTRGVLCYFPGMAIGLGMLVSFSLSTAMPWRYAILVGGCAPSVVHFFATILLPNSPRWLINRGAGDEQARKAVQFFRGRQAEIGAELKDIRLSLRGRPTLNVLQQAHLIFTDWDVAKPCLLLLLQFFFDTFCGGVVLTQYAPAIFRMTVTSLGPIQGSQLLGALQVLFLCGSAALLHWFGRRTILIWSGVLGALGMATVAAFFQFEASLADHTWMVMVGILVASAGSQGGISPLSHLFCGELLPLAVRQMFGNIVSLYQGGLGMTFIHLFPALRERLGLAGLFGVLAGVNLLQVVFARCLLPETRGLTLEEVQLRHFSTKRRQQEEDAAAAAAAETGGRGAEVGPLPPGEGAVPSRQEAVAAAVDQV